MKKYFFLLLLPLCMGLMACGDDDDNDDNGGDIKLEKLYGLWEMTHAQGYVTDEDGTRTNFNTDINTTPKVVEYIEMLDAFEITRLEFQSGNQFKGYQWESGKEEWRLYADDSYTLKGNELTLGIDSYYRETLTIKSLSDSQLVVYEKLEEEDMEITATYKKVK